MKQQWTHYDFLTSHTLSWKMKKFVPQKIASRINTKNDIFHKQKHHNQKRSTPMNLQHSHKASTNQKMKKFVLQKIASRMNTKKTYFSNMKTKTKIQNSHEPPAYPQRNNNSKKYRCVFQRCQNWRNFSSQDQKLVETTNLWQLFSDKKLPQLKSASARIANPEELMDGKTMNTSSFLN